MHIKEGDYIGDVPLEQWKTYPDSYGEFHMSGGVRLSSGTRAEGYMLDTHREDAMSIPLLYCQVSRERIAHAFASLLEQMPPNITVYLSSFHDRPRDKPKIFVRDDIPLSVLQGTWEDFDGLVRDDGAMDVAVHAGTDLEVVDMQMHRNKLMKIKSYDMKGFIEAMRSNDVRHRAHLQIPTEMNYIYRSSQKCVEAFHALCQGLGAAPCPER